VSSYVYSFYVSSNVCVFSVLCVVITCVFMTHAEHDPMMEIVAKPLYVTLLELVLEFRCSEPALRVTVSKHGFEFRRPRAALRVTLSAAQPALRITWPSFVTTTVLKGMYARPFTFVFVDFS
jgi:hypothetical protein